MRANQQTMRVYRVEMYDGLGPYQLDAPVWGKNTSDQHPAPGDDGVRVKNSRWFDLEDYFFGFANLSQLNDWFGDWLDELEEEGFVISVYETFRQDVLEGGKQVAFPRGQSPLISRWSPSIVKNFFQEQKIYA